LQRFSPDTFQPYAQGDIDRSSAAIDFQASLEQQVETEKGNLREPFVGRIDEDTEHGSLGHPRVARDPVEDTIPGDLGHPRVVERSFEEDTAQGNSSHPRVDNDPSNAI